MLKKLIVNEALCDDYLLEYRQRSDKIMTYTNWFLTFVTLSLTPLYNTYNAFVAIAIPTLLLSIYLEKNHSGELITRLFMGSSFMIFTGLIIHQNFGDIESHFSAFGLIGILLYYRDWRVIVTALIVITLHHLVLGYVQTLGVAIYVFDAQNFWELFFLHVGYFIPFIAMMLYLSVWLRRDGYESVLLNTHLEEEVTERTKELEEQTKIAENATKAKDEFLANMSHEIRTPMTGLLGFVDRLAKGENNPERIKQFQTIRKSGETLLEIINDILDFSKIESGKLEVESSPFMLSELLKNIHQMFQELASSKDINMLSTIHNNTPECIFGDETRLKQVLFNLVNNAIKFTGNGGNITLQSNYKEETQSIYIAVIDTGVGIAKENIDKIFDAFSQEDVSTTRKFGGTGLGLTISSRFVKLMGGELKVESEIAKGSKFYFELPVEICTETNCENISIDDLMQDIQFQGHILIVEDNKTNQMLLGMILDDHGLTYDVANDGTEGVLKSKQTQYDVILMDENMPHMNGIEATNIIRKEEIAKHTPIIAVTANALIKDRERFIDAGMDDYVSKPYTEEDIVKVLKKYLA